MSHLLIVEDDDATREVLSSVLRSEGYDVACAEDGREALGHLAKGDSPCLILTDIVMPGMDGETLISTLRADARLRAIPVVALSAGRVEIRGVYKMKKPFDLERLLDVVEAHCAHRADEAEVLSTRTA